MFWVSQSLECAKSSQEANLATFHASANFLKKNNTSLNARLKKPSTLNLTQKSHNWISLLSF